MSYQAEYIWIDGTEPTRKLRSKTKIVADGKKPPVWGFDGSSTNQATGDHSDCVLEAGLRLSRPAARTQRRARHVRGLEPGHDAARDATRAPHAVEVAKTYASFEPMFGIEQEYTFFQGRSTLRLARGRLSRRPRARTTAASAAPRCPDATSSRPTRSPAMRAGIGIEGTNAEVMMGQWEFQVGVLGAGRDRRPALDRALAARAHRRRVRRRRELRRQAHQGRLERRGRAHQLLDQADARGRVATTPSSRAARRSATRVKEHIAAYGDGIEERLTGAHETAPYTKFSYGVSNRGASVRIPAAVARDEARLPRGPPSQRQRRPLRGLGLIIETICGAASQSARQEGRRRRRPPRRSVAKKAPAKKATQYVAKPLAR